MINLARINPSPKSKIRII